MRLRVTMEQTNRCTVFVWGSWSCTRMFIKSMSCVNAICVHGSSLLSLSVLMRVFLFLLFLHSWGCTFRGGACFDWHALPQKGCPCHARDTYLNYRERVWNAVSHVVASHSSWHSHSCTCGLLAPVTLDTHAWCQHNCPNQHLKSVLIITHQQLLQWRSNVLLMT